MNGVWGRGVEGRRGSRWRERRWRGIGRLREKIVRAREGRGGEKRAYERESRW